VNTRALATPPASPRVTKCLALLSYAVLCGSGPAAQAAQPPEPGLDIRAAGLSFTVKEPRGWFADSTIAHEFGATVIFYPVAGDPRSAGTPVIRVILRNRDVRRTDALLDRELKRYRSMDETVRSASTPAANARYRSQARRYCVQNGFCDYVGYVDPGRLSNAVVWVLLRQPRGAASAPELSAYQRVIASIEGLPVAERKNGRERADL
jgi:hypothetical protein